jgi:putative ABC transport system permease protein
VIIGEMFFAGRVGRSIAARLGAAVSGSVAYRLIVALALKSNVFPAYMLKLVSALIVLAALSLPALRAKGRLAQLKREARRNARNS